MRGGKLQRGRISITNSVRTVAWVIKPRMSSLRRPRASPGLSERQGTQPPSLAPRAPPSPLKPENEQQEFVVFLRERKRGAGHPHPGSNRRASSRSLSYSYVNENGGQVTCST